MKRAQRQHPILPEMVFDGTNFDSGEIGSGYVAQLKYQ